MKRFLLALVAYLGLIGWAVAAHVEADPSKDYHVAPDNGQWFICAAGYRGESARDMAHELVLEIRRKYNLPAYVFDRGGEDRTRTRRAGGIRRRHLGLDCADCGDRRGLCFRRRADAFRTEFRRRDRHRCVSSPSPRLRGEGRDEGESPRAQFAESPPHPPDFAALRRATSPRTQGEVKDGANPS